MEIVKRSPRVAGSRIRELGHKRARVEEEYLRGKDFKGKSVTPYHREAAYEGAHSIVAGLDLQQTKSPRNR